MAALTPSILQPERSSMLADASVNGTPSLVIGAIPRGKKIVGILLAAHDSSDETVFYNYGSARIFVSSQQPKDVNDITNGRTIGYFRFALQGGAKSGVAGYIWSGHIFIPWEWRPVLDGENYLTAIVNTNQDAGFVSATVLLADDEQAE
jgi:hypothetical protein